MAAFKPFRRKRRADDGKFLPKDAKAWKALIKAARYQVRAPLASTDVLDVAAARATKAAQPRGHGRDSAFRQLIAEARGFSARADAERMSAARRLAALCDECQAALDAAGGEPLGRPPRLDIFG